VSTGPAVALDLSGGRSGGAGRFREQWTRYASTRPELAAVAIGADESVSPRWLVRREFVVRGRQTVIAANNVGFSLTGDRRVTLLRNANHFLTAQEWERTGHLLGRSFPAQVRLVRSAARRSQQLVVPSSSMAERVVEHLPDVADRLVVRFHPLDPMPLAASRDEPPVILCPIVDSPFKGLAGHLLVLHSALGERAVRVVSTSAAHSAPAALREDPRFAFVGTLPREALADVYARATAVYYPTTVESFGYPLAEARASGLGVIAQQSAHNAEIAGPALHGFIAGSPTSLADAVDAALGNRPAPDPAPFARDAYFDWLVYRSSVGPSGG
jgi:glycosyltransferase involved in cell wall biosynthesis